MTINRKTPDERKAEREALLATVTAKVTALTGTQEWIAYLDFMASFRRFSINNQLLIAAQRPSATLVAGYRQWQARGRQVRKGERAIKIIGHSTKKITTIDPAAGEETEDRIPRWPLLSVFDWSQTAGEELPTGGYALPTGQDPAGVADRVSGWLTAAGWRLEREDLHGTRNGYTDPADRRVVLDSALSPAGRAAVMLHEAAHVVLHGDLAPGEYQTHRGRCETEAESTAYVLAHLLHIPAEAKSIPHIASWSAGDTDLIRAAAAAVLTAVNTIAAALGLDEDTEEAAGAA